MKTTSDDDSKIEDFCLEYLFEEVEDLPEKLTNESFNNSTNSDSVDCLKVPDSFVECVSLAQPEDNLYDLNLYENSRDELNCYLHVSFIVILIVLPICYIIGVATLLYILSV